MDVTVFDVITVKKKRINTNSLNKNLEMLVNF